MKSFHDRRDAELAILAVLPGHAAALARLRLLAQADRLPVVSVLGKYNHGKSRLLNELMGQDAFSVADKRETLVLSARDHEGVRWLDAPGLDADVDAGDDGHALRAAWLESDVRLFVHAVTEGELDASEQAQLGSLLADARRTRRQTLFVLSQADQAADDGQLLQISSAIERRIPGLGMHLVSATRHRQGLDRGSVLMTSRSGIPDLKRALQQAVGRIPQARNYEASLLSAETLAELHLSKEQCLALAVHLRQRRTQERLRFDNGLAAVLEKTAADIQDLLDVPGPDDSLTPDSFANQFKLTAGKLERNRLQVGYFKACMAINAVLIRHGVTELPQAQRTAVRSLDNVMVAVMGVYVKYRKELHRIFCESDGRERMQREFARYFELSSDRVELAESIVHAERDLNAADRALAALDWLQAPSAMPA